ncbi:MAG: hypothetical protein AAF902_19425 [Chloroflexota bacterium]
MGVSALLSEFPKDEFEDFKSAGLFTTFDHIHPHPLLKNLSVYNSNDLLSVSLGKRWFYVDLVFGDLDEPLRSTIMGDYHYPDAAEKGIDEGGYLYEGFVLPETVKKISELSEKFSRSKIITELQKHSLVANVDFEEDAIEAFYLLFRFYDDVAKRGNAVAILLS